MVRLLHTRGVVVTDAAGVPVRMVGTCHDVTERKALEDRLAHQASHDALTGLPNRILFLERLGRALEQARRGRAALAPSSSSTSIGSSTSMIASATPPGINC